MDDLNNVGVGGEVVPRARHLVQSPAALGMADPTILLSAH
jgi:hypothetical protein